MKIFIIVDDYLPFSIKNASKMMHELACEFISDGHEVTVLTPEHRLSNKKDITILDGVVIYRFKSGEIKNIGKSRRAINESLLSYHAWKNLESDFNANYHDLIIYYSPSIFFGTLVKKLKELWKAPSYLILRDFFPQWAIDQGFIRKNSLIEKYFRYFEAINYKSADVIGLMSDKNLKWFQANLMQNKKLEVLYNWASDSSVKSNYYYKELLHLENKIVYFYGGNIGYAQDMMNIVRLARSMLDYSDAHFVLVGSGDEVDLVKSKIQEYDLHNMTLLPSVDQTEFKQMLSEFDVGLFTLHKDHSTHNFPGKLLGYMVQELPILGSINYGNDLKEIVDRYEAGLISINGEDDILLENAIKLLDHNFRKQIGLNANLLLKSIFTVEAAANKILDSMKNFQK